MAPTGDLQVILRRIVDDIPVKLIQYNLAKAFGRIEVIAVKNAK
jgi:hypothetical protein